MLLAQAQVALFNLLECIGIMSGEQDELLTDGYNNLWGGDFERLWFCIAM